MITCVVLVIVGMFLVFSGNFVSGADGMSKSPTSIPNFVFEKNSDWVDAFDIVNYYALSGHPSGFGFLDDPTNVDGEYIDHDFNLGGGVKFKPAADFVGTRSFQLKVVGIESNIFSVTIVEDLNATMSADSETNASKNVKYGAQDGVSGGIGWVFWVIVVLIVIVLLAAGLWFFKFRKKRSPVAEVAPTSSENDVVSTDSSVKKSSSVVKTPIRDSID